MFVLVLLPWAAELPFQAYDIGNGEDHISAFRLVLPTQTFHVDHCAVVLGVALRGDGFYSGPYIFLLLFPSTGSSDLADISPFPMFN